MTKRKVQGPSGLVGAWYDLKAEVDKVANRLSGMVVQAEKLRERLEKEYGITVPSLAVMVAATGERAIMEVVPAGAKDTGGAQLPLEEGGYRPPVQRAVEISEPSTVPMSSEKAVELIRQTAALSEEAGADERQFAKGVAGMLNTIKRTMQ